jgi:PAS domain S-box-containing protein
MAESNLPPAEALKEILSESLLVSPLSVIITDHTQPDEPIIFVNHAFEKLTGYRSDEVLGLNPRFLHGEDAEQPALESIRRSLYEERDCVAVLRDYRKDKTPIWVEVQISPLRNMEGKITHFIGFQRDISAYIELEEQRDAFVASLVHDIKSPLTGAARMFELILNGQLGKLESGLENAIQQLQQSNQRILSMLMNVLEEYRHFGSAQLLHLEEVDLTQLVSNCVTEIIPLARANKVNLKTTLGCSEIDCVCDRQSIYRLVINLLDNAVKFNSDGGVVDISLATSNGTVIITVSDTGDGIPSSEMSGLFTKFTRGRTERYKPGSGLGLYICRKIVDSHNGRIACSSEVGKGTKFTVAIPRQPDLPIEELVG